MPISPLISFVMEVLIMGFIVWVIYKFFTATLKSLKQSFLTVHITNRNSGLLKKTMMVLLNILNQIVSFILLIFIFFLFPAICILLISFFNQVICEGKTLSFFFDHLPETVSTMAQKYAPVTNWLSSLYHRLTS